MLRSAASPGSVGFGRFGSGTSGLLMTPLPAGHLLASSKPSPFGARKREGRPQGALAIWERPDRYLILDSRNSTCFFATGSYFFLVSLSVIVREFFLVT